MYAIILFHFLTHLIVDNSTKRTISVVFRGSVLEGMDWPTNLRAVYETGDPIKVLEESIELKKKIRVHKGFNSKFVPALSGTVCATSTHHLFRRLSTLLFAFCANTIIGAAAF